jgi:hypothetical protein
MVTIIEIYSVKPYPEPRRTVRHAGRGAEAALGRGTQAWLGAGGGELTNRDGLPWLIQQYYGLTGTAEEKLTCQHVMEMRLIVDNCIRQLTRSFPSTAEVRTGRRLLPLAPSRRFFAHSAEGLDAGVARAAMLSQCCRDVVAMLNAHRHCTGAALACAAPGPCLGVGFAARSLMGTDAPPWRQGGKHLIICALSYNPPYKPPCK